MSDTETQIVAFLKEEQPGQAIAADTELIETGMLDSIALIKLIQFLETTFGITVPDEDVDPEIFQSPATISAYVARRKAA